MVPGEQYLAYHHNLSQLVHSRRFLDLPRPKKLQTMIQFCSQVLDSEQITVWHLPSGRTHLQQEAVFPERPQDRLRHETDVTPPVAELFDRIWSSGLMTVADASENPLADPLGNRPESENAACGLVVAPIHGQDQLAGILCIRVAATDREWTFQEQSLICAVADTISLMGLHEEWRTGQEALEHLANHDDETGLPNRRSLLRKLAAEVQAPPDSAPLTLVWIDIDRFKAVADSPGAQASSAVTETLSCRLSDCGSANDMVARLSKDEFALLLRSRSADNQSIQRQIDRIQEAIRHPIYVNDSQLSLTASIGIAPHTGQSDNVLLDQAEAAMLEAKAAGGNQTIWFSQALHDRRTRRVTLESRLRQALDEGELVMHYQPVFSVEEDVLASLEALIRWEHPELNTLPPGDFLPMADRAGLMREIDDYVLQQVCRDQKTLLNAGYRTPIAANISGIQLADADFPERIRSLLADFGLPGKLLELEITESAIRGDTFAVATNLQRIAETGVQLAIDDFGTGYSSLGRLKYLPFHKLKIDRSFIVDTPDDPDICSMLDAIVSLGHGLSLKVVAEGIERPEQVAWLRHRGAHYLQGFHLGRPMALDALLTRLAGQQWQIARQNTD